MIRYHNKNNGDIVERTTPDKRLDFLPNWERIDADETPDPVKPDGVLARPQASPGVYDPSVSAEELADAEPGEAPARSASKGAWQSYARERAVSDEERAEIDGLTKELLIAKYGEDA